MVFVLQHGLKSTIRALIAEKVSRNLQATPSDRKVNNRAKAGDQVTDVHLPSTFHQVQELKEPEEIPYLYQKVLATLDQHDNIISRADLVTHTTDGRIADHRVTTKDGGQKTRGLVRGALVVVVIMVVALVVGFGTICRFNDDRRALSAEQNCLETMLQLPLFDFSFYRMSG